MPITDAPRQPSEEMLSPREAARLLGVHTETVRRYIRQGHLPAHHLGTRTLRVKRSDIENLARAYVAATTEAEHEETAVTLRGSAGERLQEQAQQAGITAEEMTSYLLTDFEQTIASLESGYADLDAGRVLDFEQYVASRQERRARKTAE